jgi:hypothetical protein
VIRVSRRFALFVGLVSILALPAGVEANHSWNGYHWARTANPFTLKLGDNVSGSWDGILTTTSSDWSKSTVLDTSIAAGRAKARNCRPTSGRDEICNATYGRTGWLGVAQIWLSGKHITQGTVKVNDTYFNTSTYNTTPWRNLVMCQEVGHTLGLDHQDTNFDNTNLGTCMDYTSNPLGPPDNEHPNKHDYDELVTIYSHLDSITTVGQSVRKGARDLVSQADWGREIARSAGGHTSVFLRDLGSDGRVVTFVIWAR